MTLGQALQWAGNTLNTHDIEDGHLEARILLGHLLQLTPVELYTQSGLPLNQQQFSSYQQLIHRRLQREPSPYITGHREFYGIDFLVNQNVLIPRPETELLVEEAIKLAKSRDSYFHYPENPMRIADIGTGSGAIAINLALNRSYVKVYAIDMSPSALEVATLNSKHYKVAERITFLQGNLLEPLFEPVDLIIANLPYVKCSDLASLSPEIIRYEPLTALNGGQDGLDQIRQLTGQVNGNIRQQANLLIEIGENQDKPVIELINHTLPNTTLELIPDGNGINRVVKVDL
jgi:release factor glutamine methyltransferase